jgi:exosome complex protein LRP1
MSLLSEDVDAKLTLLEEAVTEVETHLTPLLDSNLDEIAPNLKALESCELNCSLAYAATSLFFMYLRTQGVDPTSHPVHQEIDRVQSYMKKLRSAVDAEKEDGQRLRVDSEAATRIVRASLGAEEAEELPEGRVMAKSKRESGGGERKKAKRS